MADGGPRRAVPTAAAAARAAVLLSVLVGGLGCAQSAAQIAWDDAWDELQPLLREGRFDEAEPLLIELEAWAPREIDRSTAVLTRAAALFAQDRSEDAIRVYLELAESGLREADRARARYQIARWAERDGRLRVAVTLYRALVLVYPELMPGERSLAHLERIFEGLGRRGVEAHLRWTRAAYERLQDTSLGDNLVFWPAKLAHRRFVATGDPRWAAHAERLYLRIHEVHRREALWNDAWWNLSLLYRRQGRVDEEIHAIRRIQSTRVTGISLFGHDEHTYFWQGQLRIAYLELMVLDDPEAAAASFGAFIARYPDSIWLDDAYFWQGCAWLRAGRRASAEASFARIPEAYEHSKYLRRLDAARAEPTGSVCDPRDFAVEDLR